MMRRSSKDSALPRGNNSNSRIDKTWSIRDLWALITIGVAATVLFGFSAFVDPEPHHDGIQLAPAIGIARGLWIQSQVFDQYGPITAWLHAGAISIWGPHLLVLRIFTAAVLSGCAILTYVVGRQVSNSRLLAFAISVLWVALWPGRSIDWITSALIPWPSTVFLLTQLALVAAIFTQLKNRGRGQLGRIVIGVLLGIACLIRPNAGLPLTLATLAILPVYAWPTGTRLRRLVGVTGLALVPAVVVLFLMYTNNSTESYLQQAIIGPLFGGATGGAKTDPSYYKNVYLFGSIPLGVVIGILLLTLRWSRVRRTLWVVLVVAATAALCIWSLIAVEGFPLRTLILQHLTWMPVIETAGAQIMFTSAVTTFIVGTATVVYLLVTRNSSIRLQSSDTFGVVKEAGPLIVPRNFVVLALLAFSSIFQLYPLSDAYHLWWASPLMLLLFASAVSLLARGMDARWLLLPIVLPFLLVSGLKTLQYVQVPREAFKSGVLAGMWGTPKSVLAAENADALLSRLPSASTLFLCRDGLFSVWNGKFLSSSPGFVEWAFGIDPEQVHDPSRILKCVAKGEDENEFHAPIGWTVVRTVDDVSLSYFSSVKLILLERSK